jgi:zinc/manganese transport system ATP-binding protein
VLLVSHDINPLLAEVDRIVYIAYEHSAIGTPNEVITSETLTSLYSFPVEVLRSMDRVFVVGVEI